MNVRKLKGFLRMMAPAICSCLAAAGVIVTGVLSAKAALKAGKAVDDENLSTSEKAKKVIPAFIPPVVAGGSTIGLIFAANAFGQGQQAALATMFASMYKPIKKWHDEERYGGSISNDILTFYEPFSKRYFKKTLNEVLEAEYHLNRNFILRGETSPNEFYRFLGLDETEDGDKYGWSQICGFDIYGYQWIDFQHIFMPEGSDLENIHHVAGEDSTELANCDCYLIYMDFPPTDDYLTYPYEE